MPAPRPRLNDADARRFVVQGTVAETGAEFFRALVKNLAAIMGTAGAWVTEYLPEQRRRLAWVFWINGAFIEHDEYPIAGTACEPVVENKRRIHIPDRLLEMFPNDSDIRALNAVSYLGVPTPDRAGGGVLFRSNETVLVPTKPMLRDACGSGAW